MPEIKINICGEGAAIFAQKYGLDRHVSQKHGEIEKCDQCEYKAHSGTTMKDHKMSRHEGKPIICGQFDAKFERRNNLKRHIIIKHEGGGKKCDQCEYKARDTTTMKNHKMSKHEEGKFIKCDQCNKQFSYDSGKSALSRHISIDHELFRFECTVCHYTCKSKYTLKGHTFAVHEDNPKLKCDACEKVFTGKQSLNAHKHIAHTRKATSCKECMSKISRK